MRRMRKVLTLVLSYNLYHATFSHPPFVFEIHSCSTTSGLGHLFCPQKKGKVLRARPRLSLPEDAEFRTQERKARFHSILNSPESDSCWPPSSQNCRLYASCIQSSDLPAREKSFRSTSSFVNSVADSNTLLTHLLVILLAWCKSLPESAVSIPSWLTSRPLVLKCSAWLATPKLPSIGLINIQNRTYCPFMLGPVKGFQPFSQEYWFFTLLD